MTEAVDREGEQVLTPTRIDDIKHISQGEIVELPAFLDGTPFIARLRRPALLQLAKLGTIPNTLAVAVDDLIGVNEESKSTMAERAEVLEIIASQSMLEPPYEQAKEYLDNGQYMAIWTFVTAGARALEPFRAFRALLVAGPDGGEVEDEAEPDAGDS